MAATGRGGWRAVDQPVALPGRPFPLGATLGAGGTNVAVASEVADQVQLCLFDSEGRETRIELDEYDFGVWHGFVPGRGPGDRYGLRVDGPYDPGRGLRYNPAKLLLDPYAGAIDGDVAWDRRIFGYDRDAGPYRADGRDGRDSAAAMPRSVVSGVLRDQGLTNYWGYDPIGIFAPHAGYSSAARAATPAGRSSSSR